MSSELIVTNDLSVTFNAGGAFSRSRRQTMALKSVSLSLVSGETLGIVGESGCGKSTLGRTLLGLLPATSGSVSYKGKVFDGRRVEPSSRRNLQIVHQDPYASFNPIRTVGQSLREPLVIHGAARSSIDPAVRTEMAAVGISPELSDRYPHEFSGGQLQRLAIARALLLRPEVVLFDESVSALDVSIRAQVLDLLESLKAEHSLSYVFISHDLSVIEQVSTRVAVMYLGRIVELSDASELFAGPAHPYSKALLSAIPIPDPKVERTRQRIVLRGDVPNARLRVEGCEFRPRCPLYQELGRPERCASERPELRNVSPSGGAAACHFVKSDGESNALQRVTPVR